VDTVMVQHGMRVAIDPQSQRYMDGSTIDYVDGPAGGGFHIENPNAVSNCGGGCSSCH
jgi:iron-sulfur cluster assembly protein